MEYLLNIKYFIQNKMFQLDTEQVLSRAIILKKTSSLNLKFEYLHP